MIEGTGYSLSVKLEALIDSYGIKELLHAVISICWGRAAKATEKGQDPSQWSELAVRLGRRSKSEALRGLSNRKLFRAVAVRGRRARKVWG
jgi:hypothetical protein